MKKLLLLSLFLFGGLLQAQAQEDAIARFFSTYMEDDRFSRVYISPKMMQMAGGFLKSSGEVPEEEDLGELIQKIRGIRILSSDKVDGLSLYREAYSTLTKQRYEELMDVQDEGSQLKFLVREEGNLIKELLMISGSRKEFTLLSMLGNFTYEDLNMLSENTNIPGMDHYKNSKNK